MEEEIRNYVVKDLSLILPLVSLIILLVLFISFRRWEGVILPFIPLTISVAWMMGGMALFNAQIGDLLKEALLNAETMDPTAEELIQGFNIINNYGGAAYNEIPIDPAKYGLDSEDELNALLKEYYVLRKWD